MAKYEGSVPYTGFIAPADDTDTFNVTDERFNKGGYRSVINQVERLAITPERRKEGMLVKQLDTGGYWTLEGGITNNDWVEPEFATGASEDLRWDGGSTGLDVATGRASLGLGTAATLDAQTSSTDTTTGRLMQVGSFGLGLTANDTTDHLNSIITFMRDSGTATTNVPVGFGYGSIISVPYGTNYNQSLSLSLNGRLFYSWKEGAGNPVNSVQLYTTGNLVNPVTGTGTSGYLPKFTGTSALDNSVIYETGGNVAIGKTTVTSGYKLDVNGATAMTGLKVGTLSGTTRMNGGVMEAASIIIAASEPVTLGRLNGDIWVKL